MTVQEAIKELKERRDSVSYTCGLVFDVAIESMEKQIPKKPIMKKREHILHYECPCCGFTTLLPHCGNCGQKIDWEEGGTSD